MAGFSSFRDYQDQVVDGGQSFSTTFRKTTSVATSAGTFYDGSMFTGHPVTNFYASTPLKAEYLVSNEGIQHGPAVSPKIKHLKNVYATCSVALTNLVFYDSLLYYPFIEGDNTDPQELTNTNPLTRNTTGAGVMAMVVAQGTYVGGTDFYITYTNQDGVSGRISKMCRSNTRTTAGCVLTSGAGAGLSNTWFIPLADGDTGIRSVQFFKFEQITGGIFALVLVKELGTLCIREANYPAEKDFLLETGFNMPVIPDGAFLSFLASANGSLAAAPIYGNIKTVWG